jgi:hypothetical protein
VLPQLHHRVYILTVLCSYSTDAKSLSNRFVHLTNSSVNNRRAILCLRCALLMLRNSKSSHSDVTDDDKYNLQPPDLKPKLPNFAYRERGGSKVSLEFCFKRMQQRGIDTDALWLSIMDVVCKSLCVSRVAR